MNSQNELGPVRIWQFPGLRFLLVFDMWPLLSLLDRLPGRLRGIDPPYFREWNIPFGFDMF